MDANVSVQSLQRAFSLLELLAARPSGMTLGEIALRSKLHKSTAHRLLRSLIAMGYVNNRGLYALSPRLFELGCRAVENLEVKARPLMRELSARTGETTRLVVRDGNEALCVYVVENPAAPRTVSRVGIGQRFPLYATAPGKAILSTLTDDEVRAVWEGSTITAYTNRTVRRLVDLLSDLRRIRAQGCAMVYEEHEPGIVSIAGALPVASGPSEAAVSIRGPLSRLTNAKISEIAGEIKTLLEQMRL